MFVSPTEPPAFRVLGATSSVPEEYGVDFLWQSTLGLVGVQRKRVPDDFLASVHDDRLSREFHMMQDLDLAVLLLEGKMLWTSDGRLIRDRNGKRNGWTRTQHRNYLASVQLRGITLAFSDSIQDTIAYLGGMQVWSDKEDHQSLLTRHGRVKTEDRWGRITNADYGAWLLQSLPGVGPKQARAIIQHLGFPCALTVTREQLMTVPGIGKGRAEKIWKVFNS